MNRSIIKKILILLLVSATPFGILTGKVLAQNLSYMDESGNIHFVDSIHEVPDRYLNQIIKPTPGPQTKEEYKRQMDAWKKQKADDERERKQEQLERKKLEQQAALKNQHKRTPAPRGNIDNASPQLGLPTPVPVPVSTPNQ